MSIKNPKSSPTKHHAPDSARASAAVLAVEKVLGPGTIAPLDNLPPKDVAVIGSGSITLDAALGVRGYPRGRVAEIFGPESSGKTTLALHAIAEAQKSGGVAAFIDAEHAFDLRYAKRIGVQPSQLLMSQPDYGEQALDVVEVLAKSGDVDLIVVDSVAALTPKAEIDGVMGDHHVGLHARLMSRAMRKLAGAAYRTNTTLLFINQLRQKVGVVFGSPETTTGGQALKFYSSVRLDVRRGARVTTGDSAVGNKTRVRVVKNKVAPPFGESEFEIRWGEGIDHGSELLELAINTGSIEQKGGHYTAAGERFAHGKESARKALLENPRLRSLALAKKAPGAPAKKNAA